MGPMRRDLTRAGPTFNASTTPVSDIASIA